MFCQNCGAFDADDAKFCSQCGESLIEVPRREGFFHLRIRKSRTFSQGLNFLRVLLDFPFHRSSFKMIGFLYRLSILSAFLFALLFVVVSLETSQRFGLSILLLIAFLGFLSIVTVNRVILELVLVIFRAADQKTPLAEGLESKDQIEWNVE
jgi:hypothetical protein